MSCNPPKILHCEICSLLSESTHSFWCEKNLLFSVVHSKALSNLIFVNEVICNWLIMKQKRLKRLIRFSSFIAELISNQSFDNCYGIIRTTLLPNTRLVFCTWMNSLPKVRRQASDVPSLFTSSLTKWRSGTGKQQTTEVQPQLTTSAGCLPASKRRSTGTIGEVASYLPVHQTPHMASNTISLPQHPPTPTPTPSLSPSIWEEMIHYTVRRLNWQMQSTTLLRPSGPSCLSHN